MLWAPLALGLAGCQADRAAGGAPPAKPAEADSPVAGEGGDLSLAAHTQGAAAMTQRMVGAYEARAREALQKGDLRDAYLAYKRLIPYKPNDPGLAMALERIAAHLAARTPGALTDQEVAELAEIIPALKEADPPRAHVYRTAEANLLVRGGQTDEAIVVYRAVLDNQPDYVDAHENLALAYSRQGKHDKALESLRRAQELSPDSPSIHNSMGAVLVATGDLDAAIEQFRAAIKTGATSLAHLNLGEVLGRKGQADEAIKEYERATQIDPQSWEAWERLGSARLQKQEWKAAHEALQRAAELRRSGDLVYKIGVALMGLEQPERALDLFSRLARDNPDSPEVFLRIGELREGRGETPAAIDAYTRAYELMAGRSDLAEASGKIAERVRALQQGQPTATQMGQPAPQPGQPLATDQGEQPLAVDRDRPLAVDQVQPEEPPKRDGVPATQKRQ
jgi:tetratricopeptide (TPR) repeat protein